MPEDAMLEQQNRERDASEEQQKSASQPQSTQKTDNTRQKPVYSRPVFKQEVTVHSLQAQRVINRSLSRVSYSLFSLDVILQIIGKREEIDEVEEVVHGNIEKSSEELDKKIQQLSKLMEQHGIESTPSYTNPVSREIEITSPQVAQFAQLIRKLDQMMMVLDTLWLHGVLTSKQRTNAAQQWQQHLNKLASRIIEIEKRARISAHTAGKSSEVDAKAPATKDDQEHDQDDTETTDAESAQQDKAVQEEKVASASTS